MLARYRKTWNDLTDLKPSLKRRRAICSTAAGKFKWIREDSLP
jgi:hypothetical protein